ncbi:hypothetical protein Ctaglu_26240 [Clostridium tagluense]|uniref:Uncharacterized protein n=1 Tax=Clostridium tagluense TaxID=360422 RepID=A0A401UNC1_9CLOT|nr:hypothetical protein Ctaglu_26240 [Clostridium tagluense]
MTVCHLYKYIFRFKLKRVITSYIGTSAGTVRLIEIHRDTIVEEVRSITGAELIISENLKIMNV